MAHYPKIIGKVAISNPTQVQSKCSELGLDYKKGLIFCTVPEIGFLNSDYIPCRYGLSLPYIRVQDGWEVLIEPTIIENNGQKKRWFYTGIADCGGDEGIEPDGNMQMAIYLMEKLLIYITSNGTIQLGSDSADEPFVLGNQLKSWAEDVDSAIQGIMDAITNAATGTQDGGAAFKANIVATFPSVSAWTDDALSEEIFGE